MHIKRISLILGLIAFLALSCSRQAVELQELNLDWQFKNTDSASWLPATVPGCAHLDLMANGIIPDPFFSDNEKQLQWVGHSDWEYRASFTAGDLLKRDHVELLFEGLDTYADVYLNDSLLLRADNMFRRWEVNVKDLLKPGENNLNIRFHAPERIEAEKASMLDYELPDQRGFTRKAPDQYGWDWGPKLVTSGIWKPVFIRAWDGARIGDVQIMPGEINESRAVYTAFVNIFASIELPATVSVSVNNDRSQSVQKDIRLSEGWNRVAVDLGIDDPRLWWPAGMGEQPLYRFEVELKSPAGTERKSTRTGIRKAELVMEKDSIGETFFFRINGQPVFMKGANYIPQDNFPTRVTPEKYRQTLQTALDANMNMLRVWGGGIYEEDAFYDFCDENGILVWQDFMFACNMYPGDIQFVENVRQEARHQIKRLRNHPSVVLWCGNNEVDEGWHNWGWQDALGYSPEDSAEVWNNYQQVFHELLPGAVAELAPHIPYVSSSPRIGWGHEEALLEGDMHYWGVWWGEEPFEVYQEKVGRFMSEFGFQGFPDLRTLDAVLDPADRDLASDPLRNHQKHPRGMELINIYMDREYPVPADLDHYAYVSQLVQAYGMKTALEAHRRAKPRCMGTLYWQLNDCWPVISWSSVDYFNRWKAMHYFAREIFGDFLISFEQQDEGTAVFVISDKLISTNAWLELTLMDFNGTVKSNEKIEVDIAANSSEILLKREYQGFDPQTHLLRAVLTSDAGILAQNIHYFVPVKEMDLMTATIVQEVTPVGTGLQIRLASDHLAKNVVLSCDVEGHFSDNYFDLMPNESRIVHFIPASARDIPDAKFGILQLADVLAR